jgi:segregation and condensation protein A
MSYKVDLEIYNGPMDLLLYLIRREEVDIRDIPISRIADQYIAYLDLLKGLDIELAGDFVVMAATLLELKSRALLPRPAEPEEGEEEADLEDPRETLIRQLIEYRRFKDAAAMLQERGREMARRFPRSVDEDFLKEGEGEEDFATTDFLKGVEVWDLISAFGQVVRTLGYSQAREVVYDDTPVEEAAKELLTRIERERSILFSQLFADSRSISHLLTMFLAVLELVRQRRIGAEQEADFKDVRLFVRDPSQEPPPKPITPKGARQSHEALQRKAPRRPSAHQLGKLHDMLEEPDIEKTEFDEILDSIQVPEVEAYRPIYSDQEIMGQKPAEGETAAEPGAVSPEPDAGASGHDQAGEEAPDAKPESPETSKPDENAPQA